MDPVRICIDARLPSGQSGGVEQFVIGLVGAIAQLDGPERFYALCLADHDWLRPYLGDRIEVLTEPAGGPLDPGSRLRAVVGRSQRARRLVGSLQAAIGRAAVRVPRSRGVLERAGMDLVHFASQNAFTTAVPSIFHPHDLQHEHLPQFFSDWERLQRDVRYRAFCAQAHLVAVNSRWGRADLIERYQLPAPKVHIIPLAPPTDMYRAVTAAEVERVAAEHQLPARFVLYPAQTWPHKNHIALIDALGRLRRERDLRVGLVTCGRQTEHQAAIERAAVEAGVVDQCRFLGFVDPPTLQALYERCAAVVVPTLFEAASFPVWEAFRAGRPVACSTVTSLPDQVGDAGLLFDPRDPAAIADAVHRLWTDAALVDRLVAAGARRLAAFSWDATARLFRAHYRRIAGRGLSADDAALLAAPPPM